MLAVAQPALAAATKFFVNLGYQTDASVPRCWDKSEFRKNVSHRLGWDPFREDAPIDVLVRISGTPRGPEGEVDWRNASGAAMGERHFVAKDSNCSPLLNEMAFAVSLQIQLLRTMEATGTGAPSSSVSGSGVSPAPDAAAVAAPPTSTTSPTAPPPSKPEPDLVNKKEPERPETAPPLDSTGLESPQHWSMWAGLGPAAVWRLLPSLTADARLFFGTRWDAYSIEIALDGSLPATERESDGGGFRASVYGGDVALCGHHGLLLACALVRGGALRVSGVGVDHPSSPTGFVAQAGARAGASVNLVGPWFIAGHVDGLWLLTGWTVNLNKVGFWEMPRLGAMAGIDLGVRFR